MPFFNFDRLAHWKSVLGGPAWKFLIVIPTTLLSGMAFWRDELLMPDHAAKLKMLPYLPSWPWPYWLIASLIVLILLILEGSFRVNKRALAANAESSSYDAALAAHTEELRLTRLARERENDPIQMALREAFAPKSSLFENPQLTSLAGPPNSISIIVGSGAPFETVDPVGVNRRRIVRVRIQNNTAEGFYNCELKLFNLDPPNTVPPNEEVVSELLLKSDFSIAAHSAMFVDVAYHDLGSSQALASDYINLSIPGAAGGFFVGNYYLRARLPIREYTFHLKFLQFGKSRAEVFCSIYMDGSGLLRLENRDISAPHASGG